MLPKYLVVTLRSGFGNRLLPLISGMRAAKTLGRELLYLWEEPCGRLCMSFKGPSPQFEDFFSNPIRRITRKHLKKEVTSFYSILPRPVPVIPFIDPQDESHYIVVNTPTAFGIRGEEVLLNVPGLYGKQSNHPFIEELRKTAAHLSFDERISQTARSLFEQWKEGVVGVHIRRSDFPLQDEFPLTTYLGQMKEICAEYPDTKFFVSSDDLKMTQDIKRHFPGQVSSFLPKGNKFENNRFGVIQSVVDLLCLSQTSHLIGTPVSSFSYLGWVLGKQKTFETVRPQPVSKMLQAKRHFFYQFKRCGLFLERLC